MKKKTVKLFTPILLFCIAIAFVVKFGLPQLLRAYITTGIGSCSAIPILCLQPQGATEAFTVDKAYIQELIPYEFPKTKLLAPKGFKVVQELIAKPYYKRKKPNSAEPVIYVLHEPPEFFIKLFPQVKNAGVRNNYDFMRRLMHANESGINSVDEAFFVILKSIFTPDLGNQQTVKMIQFKLDGRNYFINYNLAGPAYFFDCTILTEEGDFFKVYIKDRLKQLDLNKVVSIISTICPA
ncbi:MAG: hypothetical protein V1869_06475 [Candidatus Omnitrophota bacterium]